MKLRNLFLLMVTCTSLQGQTFFKGEIEQLKGWLYPLFKTSEEYTFLNLKYETMLDASEVSVVKYMVSDDGKISKLSKSFDIQKRKLCFTTGLGAQSGLLFGDSDTKNFFVGYNQNWADSKFNYNEYYSGKFTVEKYSEDCKLINKISLEIEKGKGKESFFHITNSENGKFISVMSNETCTIYSTEDFKVVREINFEKIPPTKFEIFPLWDFFLLNDGSLITVTRQTPITFTKYPVKDEVPITEEIKLNVSNPYALVTEISEDQKRLAVYIAYNDKKPETDQNEITKGIQLIGIDIENFTINMNTDYRFGADLLSALGMNDGIKFLQISDYFWNENSFILLCQVIDPRMSPAVIKKSFLLQVGSDGKHVFHLIDLEDDRFVLTAMKRFDKKMYLFRSTGGNVSFRPDKKNFLFLSKIGEDMVYQDLVSEKLDPGKIKLENFVVYPFSKNRLFVIALSKDKALPLILQF
ncbi:MAG: hypothetical protein V2A54_17275 [Bacteroidota bacterium]